MCWLEKRGSYYLFDILERHGIPIIIRHLYGALMRIPSLSLSLSLSSGGVHGQ
jgi:hypothetical protein